MLDHVLISEEGLVNNVKFKGSLGSSDHEMVEFKGRGVRAGAQQTCCSGLQESRRQTPQGTAWQGEMG